MAGVREGRMKYRGRGKQRNLQNNPPKGCVRWIFFFSGLLFGFLHIRGWKVAWSQQALSGVPQLV